MAEFEQGFLADLGGPEDASAKEVGLCRRLAELELLIGLVKARLTTGRGGPRRLPWAREKDLLTVHGHLTDSFTRTALALGLQRRAKPVPSLEDYIAQKYGHDPDDDDGAQAQPEGALVSDPDREPIRTSGDSEPEEPPV